MLTADLVPVRVVKGQVIPRWIDAESADNLGLAAQLIEAFAEAVGRRRGTLDAVLEEILGTGTAFMLHRGLAKLLRDRCCFETAAPQPPETLRAAVFSAASAAWQSGDGAFDRDAVLASAAATCGLEAVDLERSLFADRKDQQVLRDAELPEPRALLDRYNVALAQGVLYRARELEIHLRGLEPREYQALFRQIKFHRLMHAIERRGDGWWVYLDGPVSALRATGRYGLAMASFLPALLHFGGWTLEARLGWGKRRLRKLFTLSAADGLRPHTRLTGRWLPEEIAALPGRLCELDTGWSARPGEVLIDLGGEGVLVPDILLEHEDGRIVHVEIFGFWNKGAVRRRLRLIKRHAPPGVVVAVLGRLAAGAADEFETLPGEVVVFKRTVLPKKLLCAAERVASPGRRALSPRASVPDGCP